MVLAFAKFGKPLFSTRIVVEDLNPVWEETAYLLVTDDEVRSGELLSVQLWDSDMMSADDLVGRTNIPLHELMREPNKMHRRENTLMGFEDADQVSRLACVGVIHPTPLCLMPVRTRRWTASCTGASATLTRRA